MNKPPFEINENILNLVTTITEKLTRLEIDIDRKKDLYLRKSSKIRSVNSSCAIEENGLSEEEVISVINGKTVLAPQKEIKEVKNAYEAYTNITNYDPYEIESFLRAHKDLTTDLISESGKFRSGEIGVIDGTKVIHMGARPKYVPKLMKDLLNWAKKSNLNPLIKSSIIHFEIEFIHPFSDGNGRIGRLWQSLILCKYNNIFEYLPIETLVYENQPQYYDALSKADIDANSTVFIEFMLNMILKTIENYSTSNLLNKIKKECLTPLSKTEKEILNNLINYFDKNELLDTDTAVTILNKSKVNIRKYFGKFMKLKILIPIGENKGRKYKINNDIFL
ncbi:MAG: Fic family protein [Bacilli bacterium]